MFGFDGKTIERNQARMEAARMNIDTLREEVARLILPRQQGFNSILSPGQSLTDDMTDEYGAAALEDGVSLFEGFTMPRGVKWQKLRFLSSEMNESVVHQQWLEIIADRLFMLRNDPKSGFTNNVHESAASVIAFGEQCIWPDKRFDERGYFAGLSYQSEHIGSIWWEADAQGNPMRVHRKFKWTAEQAQREWKEAIPPCVRDALKQPNPKPQAEFEFLHVIEPNPHMKPGILGPEGMPFRACYYSCKDKVPFKEGGYRTMRRIISRWQNAVNENFGRGRGTLFLPALRASQIMMQDRVLIAELNAKRPMLAPSDELDEAILALKPWGITYGGLDEQMQPMLKPLFDAADSGDATVLHAEVKQTIDRAFYRDLLQIYREQKTHISATRTLEEIAEKGILLSPLARQETEWFSPMLDVELDLMWQEGMLDDMPATVARYLRDGGGITCAYDNELTRMRRAGASAAYLRTAEQVGVVAQFNPEAPAAFNREYPLEKVIPNLADGNGVPATWRATEEEKRAHDEVEQAKAAQQQLLEAVPVIADAARSAAGAVNGG
ncbi:portal protein [Stakelama pacifica]|uniref:Head-to-tail connecting protein n=1 Tax=Stakelama pacifica TaxID=517720 RepID=A0A4R6FPG4_9SPHN|nr:portal protein [Stakelama pacifica]TDN82980.1 head-to-tail connecting protein [Stakelama pacifica]GGO95015.1 hypothetical protein GCM10011329_18200 [Stakelama pacifica]